jgi:transcription elongation factor GreA
MEKVPMTIVGYEDLQQEIKKLKTIERPLIIEAIAEARKHGDLSENAEEQQSLNEGRISDLEDKLSRAAVIDISKLSGDTIKFGAKIRLIDEDTEEESIYQIVGEFESDVSKGMLSIASPIARALMGKTAGDSVEVATPGGGKSYEVLAVDY